MMLNNVHAYAAATNTTSSTSSTAAGSSSSTSGINPSDFMTLLVAEIQNQDPTQPMDLTTFMSQLVNLNQLEQVTQINQVVQQYASSPTASSSTPITH